MGCAPLAWSRRCLFSRGSSPSVIQSAPVSSADNTTTLKETHGQHRRPAPAPHHRSARQRVGVRIGHIRRLIAERRVPYLKVGWFIRFDPAEIATWLDGARHPQGTRNGCSA